MSRSKEPEVKDANQAEPMLKSLKTPKAKPQKSPLTVSKK